MPLSRETPIDELLHAATDGMDYGGADFSTPGMAPEAVKSGYSGKDVVHFALQLYRYDVQSVFLVARSTVGCGYVFKGACEEAFPARKVAMRIANPKLRMSARPYATDDDDAQPAAGGFNIWKFAYQASGELEPGNAQLERLRAIQHHRPDRDPPLPEEDAVRLQIVNKIWPLVHHRVPRSVTRADADVMTPERLAAAIQTYSRMNIGRYGIFDHEVVTSQSHSAATFLVDACVSGNRDARNVWNVIGPRGARYGELPAFNFDPALYASGERNVVRRLPGHEVYAGMRERVEFGRSVGKLLRERIEQLGLAHDWDRTDVQIADAHKGEPREE